MHTVETQGYSPSSAAIVSATVRPGMPGAYGLSTDGGGAAGYDATPMAGIHISDIEAAINHWRARCAGADAGAPLGPELGALAELYGRMAYARQSEVNEAALSDVARAAWLDWFHTTPDTPCIAICSTSQGDDVCKGCGRRFDEVQHWTAMSPAEKRVVWRRITLEGSSWRFNRYAERAR